MMLTKNSRSIALALVFLSVAIPLAALGQESVAQTKRAQQPVGDRLRESTLPSQEATVNPTNELQQLRERVGAVEGELQGFNRAIEASIESTNLYTSYLTFGVTTILGIFTLVLGTSAVWYRRMITSMVEQVETAREQVEQAENELSSAIGIARALPALLRSNLEETHPDRKKLHAKEAYHYITQAEAKGYTDSHSLNWKAYTLRRMDLKKPALEAAQAALECAKPGDPQKARALYNIACYYCVLFEKYDQALDTLDQAILTDESYKKVAREDPDFYSIRKNPNLKQRFFSLIAS